MIPLLLVAAGGFLIGDSVKDKVVFEEGGVIDNSVSCEYVKIANDGNSKQIWVNRPYAFDGNKFKTRTIMSNNNREYYTLQKHPKDNIEAWVTARQKMTLYIRCEEHDAEIIILPYYLGNSFENVIKVVDSDKLLFVVEGKMPLNRVQQTLEEVKNDESIKYEPKDNTILGYIAKEWIGDNTLVQIYNGQVKYIKKYAEINVTD